MFQCLKQCKVLCALHDHILEYCLFLLNVSTQVHEYCISKWLLLTWSISWIRCRTHWICIGNLPLCVFTKLFWALLNISYWFNTMFYSVFTQLQYIGSLATCFGFLQNHLQAIVNYREVYPVYAHIMESHSVYIKIITIVKIFKMQD